jgi:predicted transcriptional regulator
MGAASEYAMSQERQEILSILRNVGPKTVSQLANILGKSQDATRMNLARMKGAGILGINEKGEYQII